MSTSISLSGTASRTFTDKSKCLRVQVVKESLLIPGHSGNESDWHYRSSWTLVYQPVLPQPLGAQVKASKLLGRRVNGKLRKLEVVPKYVQKTSWMILPECVQRLLECFCCNTCLIYHTAQTNMSLIYCLGTLFILQKNLVIAWALLLLMRWNSHETHHFNTFKMPHLLVFSTCTMLCNHKHRLVLEDFYHSRGNPEPVSSHF